LDDPDFMKDLQGLNNEESEEEEESDVIGNRDYEGGNDNKSNFFSNINYDQYECQ